MELVYAMLQCFANTEVNNCAWKNICLLYPLVDNHIAGLPGRPFIIDVTIAHPTGATHMRNGSTCQNHFA